MIADLAQNAVEAKSTLVTVAVEEDAEKIGFSIKDNGCGMDAQTLERAKDPFYTDGKKHPHRSVGLGIPFLIQTAEECGGEWHIESEKGKGTTEAGSFSLTNIDTPPLGSLPELFRSVLTFPNSPEVIIHRTKKSDNSDSESENLDYTVKRSEMLDALGDLESADSLGLLDQYLEGLEEG
jgi:hypothetical protein